MRNEQEALIDARKDPPGRSGDGDGDDGDFPDVFTPVAPYEGDDASGSSLFGTPGSGETQLLQQRVIAGLDDDARVEPYRQLRTRLLQSMHENCWNTLAITSAHEGAGKTLTAVNLALSIARDYNHSVLLVDLDLRTPTVHEKLGLDVEWGLVDYLQGACSLMDAVLRPGYPRFAVLPGRPLNRFSSELLASPKMKRFTANVITSYDPSRIVIFDLPPLLRNDDALLFVPTVHAVLMVVEDGVTTDDQLDHSLSLLRGANVVGTILNKSRD